MCSVLISVGITNAQNSGYQLNSYALLDYFPKNGWKSVESYKDLEPGDVLVWKGHTQIFAYRENGVNYYVNCGWAPSKHKSVYETLNENKKPLYTAWRVPN